MAVCEHSMPLSIIPSNGYYLLVNVMSDSSLIEQFPAIDKCGFIENIANEVPGLCVPTAHPLRSGKFCQRQIDSQLGVPNAP